MLRFSIAILMSLTVCFMPKAEAQQIVDIKISGNKTTKSEVIVAELGLQVGDELPFDEFKTWSVEAKERLENLSLFLWVKIAYEVSGEDIVVLINVKERWYYWVYPILEHADRNFSAFINSKDWSRINYGVSFEKHNFRGRNEFLKLKLRFGYRSQFGVLYDNPAIDKKRKHGFQLSYDYFMQEKLIYAVQNDQPLHVFIDDDNLLTQSRMRGVYQFRPSLSQRIDFLLEFNDYTTSTYLDSIQANYIYQNNSRSSYFSVYVKYSIDKRNVKYYPTEGIYFVAKLGKQGFSMFNPDINLLQTSLSFDYYLPIKNRLSIATEGYYKAHLMHKENIPFVYAGMLGYDFYPRGYEYNLILGNSIVGLNETFRFKLYQSPELFDKVIPVEAFKPFKLSVFLYAFFDLAYVDNSTGSFVNQSLDNQLLYSYGVGLDVVSYYDRSIGLHMAMTNQNAFGIFATLRSPLYKSF